MRNPSIHVLKSDLLEVLSAYGLNESDVDSIMFECRKRAVKGRVNVTAKSRTRKKVERLVESDSGLTEKFNGVLTAFRQSISHKVTSIRKGSKDWLLLVEIASDAKEFCDYFKFQSVEDGFKAYIRSGIEMMGKKYALSKFKFYKQRIFDYHEFRTAIEQDADAEGTEMFYNVYCDEMLERTGVDLELEDVEDYVHMVFGRQEADASNADYKDWVDAQFEGLSFMNAVPELNQLYGLNAKKRYRSYMQKQGLKRNRRSDDGMPTKFSSDAEEEYWRLIREKRGDK